MDTSQVSAAVTLLQSAPSVAVLPVSADDHDAVASSLALAQVLRARGVAAHVYPGRTLDPALNFLSSADLVEAEFAPRAELRIHVPTERVPAADLTYERTDSALDVRITAQRGSWQSRDVQVTTAWQAPAALLVVVGAPRLALLGQRFTAHADVFYATPVVNVTYQPEAEQYGKANVVDRSARSCTELVAALLRHWDQATLTAPVATALYAGLMAATESFQKTMTSPAQFDLGARLLEAGADRLAVVRHLYKTKPLTHLRLWGRTLSRLATAVTSDGTRVALALLSADDVRASGAGEEAVRTLMSNVLLHAPDLDVAAVVAPLESNSGTTVVVGSRQGNALSITRSLGAAEGSNAVARVRLAGVALDEARRRLLRACDSGARTGYTGAASNKGGHSQRKPHPQEVSGRQASPAAAR